VKERFPDELRRWMPTIHRGEADTDLNETSPSARSGDEAGIEPAFSSHRSQKTKE